MGGVIPTDLFCQHFLHPLLNLQTDRIPNVRFVVSRVIASKLLPDRTWSHCGTHTHTHTHTHRSRADTTNLPTASFSGIISELEDRVQKSREDRDREVRFFAYYPLRNPSEFKRNPQNPDL